MREVLPEEASSSEEEDIRDDDLDEAAGVGPGRLIYSTGSGSDEGSSGEPEASGSGEEDLPSEDDGGSSGGGGGGRSGASMVSESSGGDGDSKLSEGQLGGADLDQHSPTPSSQMLAGVEDAAGVAAEAEAHAGPFKSQDKGAAIAKAFAKVTHGRREDVQDGAGILAGSKSVLKRQREEAAAEATDRRARHLRQEMRKRGHAKVPRRGEDPPQDAAEKLLLRTARKGVVRLFNAVSKAQRQASEQQGGASRSKAQLTKADFLAELRGKAASAPAIAGRAATQRAGAARGVSASEQAAAPDGPAWKALQDDDLAALSSGLKMKDWDKREVPSAVVEETLDDMEDSEND